MNKIIIRLNKNNILKISGYINFNNVLEILNNCIKLTQNIKEIKIDLKDLCNSNSTVIIFIINYIKNAQKKNTYIDFLNTPKPVLDLIKIYNLNALITTNKKHEQSHEYR